MTSILWKDKTFSNLSASELYEVLRLRAEIFVVEQNCVYQDIDNLDQSATHLMGYHDGQLIAYARLFFKTNHADAYAKIGRVVVAKEYRNKSIGKKLMQKSIALLAEVDDQAQIKISAQCYLNKFYESLGFIKKGESYLEDGIPHQVMILKLYEK